jgi:chromosomal replication initiator protein
VLGQLELQVTRPVFETFLKDTQGASFHDNVLTVSAPTSFVAEWLNRRAYRLIQKAVRKLNGDPVELRFQVGQGSSQSNDRSGNGSFPANGLNTRYTFDSFVVGPSNRLAFSASCAVAEVPGSSYNPLFIYGGAGLGKTHLLHAIGHTAQSLGLQAICVTSEKFTNHFISAIHHRTTEEFRARYRNADILLIDDIQFIGGKEQTQEGFFHTFNDLHEANRQIVLTSDRPPKALPLLEERLRSRFEWGLIADIQPPDLETRIAILRSKSEALEVTPDDRLIDFLARKAQHSVRQLEGLLNRLAAYCSFTGAPLSVETAQHALADLFTRPPSQTTDPARILALSAEQFNVPLEALEGRGRDKKTNTARQVVMYLLREELSLSFSDIGRLLGNRDHSTVTHAVHVVDQRMNGTDPALLHSIQSIRQALHAPTQDTPRG